MAKHALRPTPSHAKATKPRVEVTEGAMVQLLNLRPGERAVVEPQIRSFATLRKLAKTADLGGVDGRLHIADVTPEMRVAFRFTDDGAEVVMLISRGAFDYFFPPDETPAPVARPAKKSNPRT